MQYLPDTKEKWKDLLFKIVILFAIGGVFGCVYETILCWFQRGHFESRRGVIYGPFNPVYAFGAVAMYLVLRNFKKPLSIFCFSALTGGVVEYICSFVQENLFGTFSWNYTKYFMNFHGRTSLFHMLAWGFMGLVFMEVFYPLIEKGLSRIPLKARSILAWTLSAVMFFDMVISSVATIRYNQRAKHIPARNFFEIYLDEYYPDELIDRVYPNKKKIPGKGIHIKDSQKNT